ncbi:MAG TPA: FxLYD domain-containing protein [Bryobacteraceae bacterium]|nr:FxLYD domain-containing protein [Bryobacteraceae bacterium]
MVSDTQRPRGVSPVLVVVSAVVLAALGIWFYVSSRPREAPPPPTITAEGKAYVRNLRLANVDMKATANFAGAAVVEITGEITNAGNRALDRVELNCIFYDTAGQVVLRERVPIVRAKLDPGASRAFRLPFEGIPQTWNQTLPQLVIAHVAFA